MCVCFLKSKCIAIITRAHFDMENLLLISLWLVRHISLIPVFTAFQDKLLEEMWKQQDSLEGPTATAAEMPSSPEAGGGTDENSKDSNPLLERLRALEVKWIAWSASYPSPFPHYFSCSPCPFPSPPKMSDWSIYWGYCIFNWIKCISLDIYRDSA